MDIYLANILQQFIVLNVECVGWMLIQMEKWLNYKCGTVYCHNEWGSFVCLFSSCSCNQEFFFFFLYYFMSQWVIIVTITNVFSMPSTLAIGQGVPKRHNTGRLLFFAVNEWLHNMISSLDCWKPLAVDSRIKRIFLKMTHCSIYQLNWADIRKSIRLYSLPVVHADVAALRGKHISVFCL